MRLMQRNLKTVYYSLYKGLTDVTDENGFKTGEKVETYSDAVKIRASVSPSSGSAQTEIFGSLDSYDRVMLVDDTACPIDENSILFVDKEPEVDSTGKPIPDYKVRKVAKSLNGISYAIKKVNVS